MYGKNKIYNFIFPYLMVRLLLLVICSFTKGNGLDTRAGHYTRYGAYNYDHTYI